ncbi:hypothetical protein E3N88_35430 [Mikania micrantha]|uniref:Uncharacterized protein n=1 Tax=Mikania micrantha TaxID=192012 RepID=A0A5N6M0W2_9ASTR|nr:hypothetical protein E3N88_35430 [Mikania micrantha]
MNAISNSDINFTEEIADGSDTETIPDESPDYYEPISNVAIDDDDSSDHNSDSDHEPNFHRLPNGDVENGISHLDLSNEEDEEERMREEILRAFREDESRRRAPLTQENTQGWPSAQARVAEAEQSRATQQATLSHRRHASLSHGLTAINRDENHRSSIFGLLHFLLQIFVNSYFHAPLRLPFYWSSVFPAS